MEKWIRASGTRASSRPSKAGISARNPGKASSRAVERSDPSFYYFYTFPSTAADLRRLK